MKLIIMLAFSALCLGSLKAQMVIENGFHQTIPLKDSTIDKKMYFVVTEGMKVVNFIFTVNLTDGQLSFTLEDPEGKKEGGFNLTATTENGKREPSKGRFAHDVKSPIPGKWVLNIKSQHATGKATYELQIDTK